MDKKTKILLIIFSFISLASVVATYYRYIVEEDITFNTDEQTFQEALFEEE